MNIIKKITLIVPSNTILKDSIRRIATPLGLLYIAAVLEKRGYKPDIFDCTAEGYYNTIQKGDYITYGSTDDEIKKHIKKEKPDIVGINCLFSAREKEAFRTAMLVKEVDDIPVIIGGIHATLFPERMLAQPFIDYVIMGEGEYRTPALLDALSANRLPDMDGTGYKTKEGKIVITPLKTKIENLDELPLPARHLIDFEKYIKICVPYAPFPKKERVEQILTSRGCPFRCNFCSTRNFWGNHFRARSVDNIMMEIDELVKRYNIQEVQFVDDNMTVNKARSMELFKRMKKYNLSWCTPHGLAIATIDEEMIKLMAESGAYQITVAIESGNQNVLNNIIHKNLDLKKVKPLVDAAHKHNISVHGMFVVGFPGETKEQIMQTLNFPKKIGFESVSFFTACPMPGSELFDECLKKRYLSKAFKELDYSNMDLKTPSMIIPKESKDFAISNGELQSLVDEKTKEYNEWSKKKFGDKWKDKFKLFLERHPKDADLIMGRVT